MDHHYQTSAGRHSAGGRVLTMKRLPVCSACRAMTKWRRQSLCGQRGDALAGDLSSDILKEHPGPLNRLVVEI